MRPNNDHDLPGWSSCSTRSSPRGDAGAQDESRPSPSWPTTRWADGRSKNSERRAIALSSGQRARSGRREGPFPSTRTTLFARERHPGGRCLVVRPLPGVHYQNKDALEEHSRSFSRELPDQPAMTPTTALQKFIREWVLQMKEGHVDGARSVRSSASTRSSSFAEG